MGKRTRKTEHVGNVIVETVCEIEEYPDTVDYADILDACEIVTDHDAGPPWADDEGWDHDTERVTHDGQEDARNYSSEARKLIEPTDSSFLDTYRYHRARGCSKQVSAEMVALARRQRVDQLVKWYDHGWDTYGVTCDFRGHHDSVWNVIGYDYAWDEVRHDVAGEVAAELESDGYAVVGQPDRQYNKLDYHRDRLKRNLKLDCWTD